jgi:hypothetical protein
LGMKMKAVFIMANRTNTLTAIILEFNVNPIIRTAARTHWLHNAMGSKPAQPANDVAWPFRHMKDPREERK